MSEQTPEEMQARLTNYEEGINDLIKGFTAGTVDTATALTMLKAILDATGQQHLQALRQHEATQAAIMAFKDWIIRELTKKSCALCGETDGRHIETCAVETGLRAQQMHPVDIEGTMVERLFYLQEAVEVHLDVLKTAAKTTGHAESPYADYKLSEALEKSRHL